MTEAAPRAPDDWTIGRWRVDARADTLTPVDGDGAAVKLEPQRTRLLLALAERAGEVVLTSELLDRVWGDVVVTSASVYQGIAQLRRVMGDDPSRPTVIETIPRKGYRLIAPVRRVARAAAPAGVDAPANPSSRAVDAADPAPATERVPPSAPAGAAAPLAEAPASSPAPAEVPDRRVDASPSASSRPRRRAVLAGAVAGVAAAAAAVWAWRDRAAAESAVRRLAVLPFADRTPSGREGPLADGLFRDVIRGLERMPGVPVVAADSALRAVRGGASPAAAGRQLGADAVLTAELLRTAPSVRVAVRLQALPSEREIWVRTFDQPIAALATLPGTIVVAAAERMRAPAVPASATETRTPSEAYELYVLGQNAWRPKTQEAFVRARDYFQRGIDLDPQFAPNHVGLGWTWIGEATTGGGIEYREGFARAATMFERASRLDPELAEAIVGRATVAAHAGRFDDARQLLDRAEAIAPGSAQVHHTRGVADFDDGRPAAAADAFRRAVALNPLSASPLERLGLALLLSGKTAEAEAMYRRAIAIEPAYPNGTWGLGIVGYAKGDLAGAVAAYREALASEPRRPYLWSELSMLYLDLGVPDLAADAMARTAALLPKAAWPPLRAGLAWAVRTRTRFPGAGPAGHGSPPAPPTALSLARGTVPDDRDVVELMTARSFAELPIDEAALRRGVAASEAATPLAEPILWHLFQGHDWRLDLAGLLVRLGHPGEIEPWLARSERQIDRYAQRGNAFHALPFLRARSDALRGRDAEALRSLEAAVAGGCRRGWRLDLDPAFDRVRERPAFRSLRQRIDVATAAARRTLGLV